MPLYMYEHDGKPGGQCSEQFELLQKLSDATLERCPECGRPCHRVITSFAAIRNTQAILSTKNLERTGFTQYKKAGGGYYEKVCGKGPRTIKR